jgi:hypothetical protein
VTGARQTSAETTRRGFSLLAAGAGLMLAGCNTPARRFRERLTLYVETPEGEATGSSVIEHETGFQDGWLGGMANHSLVGGTRGEATVVDLGKRGLLFALLSPDKTRKGSGGPGGYEYAAFSDLNEQARSDANGNEDKRIAYFIDSLNRLKPSGDISPRSLGLLVRFRDPNDPRTVERIDPENLAASFGAGVWLKRATIEIVDEPLTTGIEKRLPWLDGLASTHASLDGDTSMARYVDAPLANELGAGYFRRGM